MATWLSQGPAPRVAQRVVTDGGHPHVEYDAVVRELSERGYQSGKIDSAVTRLDAVQGHLEQLTLGEQAALAGRLAESSNPESTIQFVNALEDTGDVRHVLEQDAAMTNRLVDWHANPSTDPRIDPDLTASELVYVTRHSSSDNIQLIVKGASEDGASQVRWLEQGDIQEGWRHIQTRHVTGSHGLSEEPTSIFPVGERVRGHTVPNRISSEDIQDMIYRAIKDGTPTQQGQKTRYYFQPNNDGYPNSGVAEMRVFVKSNGAVETAYPLSGDAVLRWVPDLNDGQGGFVETS